MLGKAMRLENMSPAVPLVWTEEALLPPVTPPSRPSGPGPALPPAQALAPARALAAAPAHLQLRAAREVPARREAPAPAAPPAPRALLGADTTTGGVPAQSEPPFPAPLLHGGLVSSGVHLQNSSYLGPKFTDWGYKVTIVITKVDQKKEFHCHDRILCFSIRSKPPKRDEKERKRRSPSPKPTKVHIGRLTRNVTKVRSPALSSGHWGDSCRCLKWKMRGPPLPEGKRKMQHF